MKSKVVIIGAGQTGRGYLARYIAQKNDFITFVDKNPELIMKLNEDKHFSIHFYHKDRTPVIVDKYNAFISHSDEARIAIKDADVIFTSVGEENLYDVAKQLKEGLQDRIKDVLVVTSENGINPKKVLEKHLESLKCTKIFMLSQTAVFCSTVNIKETRLDILSQNEDYFPYDIDSYDGEINFVGAVKVKDFENFFKRKIYTYNCLAGLISYCGYVKGYEVYGEAANDSDISKLMDRLLDQLNPALVNYFKISDQEQLTFSNKALDKFKDLLILDYTSKNGRAPARKLAPNERIMAPMKILLDNQKDPRIMAFVAAAALVYWEEFALSGKERIVKESAFKQFCELNDLREDSGVARNVYSYFTEIKEKRSNININEIIDEVEIKGWE